MKHQLKEEILLQKPSASAKELLGEHKKLKTSYPREPWFPENLMVVIKDIIETDLPKTKSRNLNLICPKIQQIGVGKY